MKASPRFSMTAMTAAFVGLVAASPVHALQLITNGGFESGLAGWTREDQLGSGGTFNVQTGTSSPVSGYAVPAPPEGIRAAMTDSDEPGAHVLYQDFVVQGSGGTVSFSLFVGNRADDFFIPPTPNLGSLDFALTSQTGSNTLNQQARVDIMRAGTDPFSVAAGDVLENLFRTNPGDPLVSGYNGLSFDVSALFAANAGQTLRLRFAETDNVNFFQFGVDNVRVEVVPEPSPMLLLFGAGLAALFAGARSRRRPGA